MLPKQALQEPLVKRLFLLFFMVGLVPTVLLIAAPTIYITLHGTESVGQSLLLMWGAQGVTFLIVVMVGAGVTLKRLVIPIQELVNGAEAIALGNLSYRVPIRHNDQAFVLLSQTFNTMAQAVETMRYDIDRQRAMLEITLGQREREFEAIVAISRLVNHQTDLHSTIEQALRIAHSVLQANTMALALFDDTGMVSSVVCVCTRCTCDTPGRCVDCIREQRLRHSLYLMQDDLLRLAVKDGRTTFVEDIHSPAFGLDTGLRQSLDELNIGKFLVKPLILRGRTVGALIPMRPKDEAIPTRAPALMEALAENIIILIEGWQLQNRSRALTIMEERRRMANELHDSVTQSLFTLSLTARGLKASVEDVPDVNHQAFDMLVEQTKVIQAEMRTLINELRPIDLDADDLENALHQHVQSLRRSAGTEVTFSTQGRVHELPRPIQQNLNRIAQEALSNIARHAGATQADVSLEVTDHMVTLMISDNGVGFDPRSVTLQHADCLGLISMRERAEMLGGALMIRSQPGKETTIAAKIPLNGANGAR